MSLSQRLVPHLPFVAVCLVFLVLVQVYRVHLPAYEGPDEPEHFAYVIWLMQEGTLPDPDRAFETAIQQQAGQAPLYYVTAAAFSALFPAQFDGVTVEPVVNPWWAYGERSGTGDNGNQFLMSEQGHILSDSQRQQVTALQQTRLLSSAYGLIALTGLYLAGLWLWHERWWAVLAVAFMAFTPQILQAFAVVSNDVAVIAFATPVIALSVRLVSHPYQHGTVMLAGLFGGLAMLSKTNGLVLLIFPLLAILMGRTDKPSWRKRLNGILLYSGIVLLIGGWWYGRNALLYGDIFGFAPHEQTVWGQDSGLPLMTIITEFPVIWLQDMWARPGWGLHSIDAWVYWLPGGVLLIGLIGLLIRVRRLQREMVLLAGVALAGFVAMVIWSRISAIVPGRLYFPFYAALILLVVTGWRWTGRLAIVPGVLAALLAMVFVPTHLIPLFGLPDLLDSPPDDLQGQPRLYGEVRFVGYQLDSGALTPNTWQDVTVCWQAPEGDDPVAVPCAYALHIIDSQDRRIAGRDTYPGLGRYTLWQPGKAFCDTSRLYIAQDAERGQVYRLSLTLYDPESREPVPVTALDGSPADAFIGQVWIPGREQMSAADQEAALYRFDGIVLLDYQLQDETALQLTWGVVVPPGRPLSLFVHLLDESGEIAAQVDPPAGGESYPAQVWGTGEKISQTVTLPVSELPTGTYTIVIGLYEPDSFARLSVVDGAGNVLTDQRAVMGPVMIR